MQAIPKELWEIIPALFPASMPELDATAALLDSTKSKPAQDLKPYSSADNAIVHASDLGADRQAICTVSSPTRAFS